MDPKAKSEFLKKIAINGFSITEGDNTLTLRPRGMEETAEVTIQEVEPDVWKVVGASGHCFSPTFLAISSSEQQPVTAFLY